MTTLLDPAILFFLLGVAAGLLKSNLEVPPALSRFLSLYLLMALGLKGGFALSKSGFTSEVVTTLACAVALAVLVPALGWWVLRRLLPPFDAVAVAATYGSVSAVTFVTAAHVLEQQGLPAGGHMAAAMALMESPAIVFGVAMAGALRASALGVGATAGEGGAIRTAVLSTSAVMPGAASASAQAGTIVLGGPSGSRSASRWALLWHHGRGALTEGGTVLLVGSLLVGLVTGESGARTMQPFTVDLFKGLLAFFLLDMGLMTARHLASLQRLPLGLLAYGVIGPVVHAALALLLARWASLSVPDATLLAVLAASASYIAVPAVLREAVPEARPALYFGLSLGLTFPFNLLIGIPTYQWMARHWLG